MKNTEIKKYANLYLFSEAYPYEVVEIKTPRKVMIRKMNSVLDKNFKPEVIPGGFVGHCVNNDEQKWNYSSNENAVSFSIRLNKKGEWKDVYGNKYGMDENPFRKYDYNF
jgi:hypothetical protein